ncbi:MAG: DPP IV N-terminal domain-containing protein [Porphyromonas sp.]|nr:DPP IV N-terminal domain-containing protein [Porphyromonas sp.]
MKKTLAVSLFLILLLGGKATAQMKTFTLDQLIPGGKEFRTILPESTVQPLLTSTHLIYMKDGEWVATPLFGSKSKETEPFLTEKSWKELTGESKIPGAISRSEDGSYLVATHSSFTYHLSNDGKQVLAKYKSVPGGDRLYHSTPAGAVAQSANHKIYIIYPDAEPQEITPDGTREVVYGEIPHRNEFGINDGMFWSPDGRLLAFYRMDQSMVTDYPLVNTSARVAEHTPVKYPMAGMASHHVTIGIYDTVTKNTVYLRTGAPEDRYFTNLAWSLDGKYLYIDEVNREQNHCSLVVYDVATGEKVREVLQETHPKYVEPSDPIVLLAGKKQDSFLRLSRNEGFKHLFLYTKNGAQRKQLTAGEWEITAFHGLSPDHKYAYFTCNINNPTERQVARVAIPSGKMELLTSVAATHNAIFNAGFTAMFDRFSSQTIPGQEDIYTLKGKNWKKEAFFTSKNPVEGFKMPNIERGTIKDASGTYDLHYKMTYPKDIKPGEKLPTIVYVYAGPHAQLVTNTWNSLNRGWDIFMAQKGYVVFTVDSRGSANRGLEFENATFRRLGEIEMEDQMKGVEFLKSLPFVDPDRIGVHGWSYGGFMTTNLMLTHSDVFKTGVAGGPVMDWAMYEVMYGERYMDTPQNNPEGYDASNLLKRAGDLKGRLLLIHGDLDPTVVWQHSIQFVRAAVDAGTYPDYMVYPGHEHNVRGLQRVHLYSTISRYFDDHLKNLSK